MSSKQIEEPEYLPIPQSDLVVKIGQLLLKLKDSQIGTINKNRIEAELKEDKMSYEILNKSLPLNMWFMDLQQAKKSIRMSLIQLLQFLLYQYNCQNSNIIHFNISDFLNLRGIKRRKESVDRLFKDFAILFGIKIQITTIINKNKQIAIGDLAVFKGYKYCKTKEVDTNFVTNKKMEGIVIQLGDWVNKINLKQYALINTNFFKYNAQIDANKIMLSLKFTQLIRSNISRLQVNQYHNCRIKTLLDFINISEIKIKKQGINYYYSLILKTIYGIEESEKYNFNIDLDISNIEYIDFIKLNIGYNNKFLMEKYKNIRRLR